MQIMDPSSCGIHISGLAALRSIPWCQVEKRRIPPSMLFGPIGIIGDIVASLNTCGDIQRIRHGFICEIVFVCMFGFTPYCLNSRLLGAPPTHFPASLQLTWSAPLQLICCLCNMWGNNAAHERHIMHRAL